MDAIKVLRLLQDKYSIKDSEYSRENKESNSRVESIS